MTNAIGLAADITVAVLLVLTIGYCMRLNRRLKLLKADEQSLRATICELVTATEIAERAIAGLKLTVAECEHGLTARLANAERFIADLDRGIANGKSVLDRLSQIAAAGQCERAPEARDAPRSDAQAVAAAAQAFAERLRLRVHGLAA